MKLKVYFLAIVAFVMATSCVDENYDLTNVTFDEVEIGSDDTLYEAPLATITITGDDLDGKGTGSTTVSTITSAVTSGSTSLSEYGFTEILELINAFLPTGQEVEIDVLIGDDDEAKKEMIVDLVYTLVDELRSSEQKVEDLATVICNYQDDVNFESIYDVLDIEKEELDVDYVIAAINRYIVDEDEDDIYDYEDYVDEFADAVVALIDDEVVSKLKEYATVDLEQTVDSVEIPSDIVDILGGEEEEVSIIATYTHNFPFTFDIDTVVLTGSDGTKIELELTQEGEEPVINTYLLSEITSILGNGATLTSGISLTSYTSIAMDDYAIVIKVSVQKSGALTIQTI